MTEDADFKQLVRERMARTGENYTQARAALRPDEPTPPGTAAGEPLRVAEPPRRAGTGGQAETDAPAEPIETGRAAESSGVAGVGEPPVAAGAAELIERGRADVPSGPAGVAESSRAGGVAEPIETGRAAESSVAASVGEPANPSTGTEPTAPVDKGEPGARVGPDPRFGSGDWAAAGIQDVTDEQTEPRDSEQPTSLGVAAYLDTDPALSVDDLIMLGSLGISPADLADARAAWPGITLEEVAGLHSMGISAAVIRDWRTIDASVPLEEIMGAASVGLTPALFRSYRQRFPDLTTEHAIALHSVGLSG